MKRRTPLRSDIEKVREWKRRRTPLTRGGSLKRSPMKRVNRERRKKLHARNFGDHADWIRTLPCDTCGALAPSDPSHAVPRGMGGCGGDKTVLLPMCRACHQAYEKHEGPPTRDEAKIIAAGYWKRSPCNPESA